MTATEIDFSGDVQEPTGPTSDQLTVLGKMVQKQLDLEDEIEKTEEKLKDLKKRFGIISEMDIPQFLETTGVSEIKLTSGVKVVIKRDLRVTTKGVHRILINAWLTKEGLDDIIKQEITVPFGKDQQEAADGTVAWLEEQEFDYNRVKSVNPQTFAALLRELEKKGTDIPFDRLGVFVQKRSKLTRPKVAKTSG